MDVREEINQSGAEQVLEQKTQEGLAEAAEARDELVPEKKTETPSNVESSENDSDTQVKSSETPVLQDEEKNTTTVQPTKPILKSSVLPFKLPTLPFKKAQKSQSSEVTSLNKDKLTDDSSSNEPRKISKANSDSSKLIPKADSSAVNDNSVENAEKQDVPESKRKTDRKRQLLSPAEKLKIPPLPYKDPSWGGIPSKNYSLEVLKSGKIVETVDLRVKSFYVFGRLECCDVTLEHPSISRYHLVLQYRAVGDSERDPGFYLYDLASTHGSQFNKGPMKAKVYYRIRVGHQFKLGGSSRIFILQGPPEDEEAGSELSVTQLKELRQKQLEEQEELKRKLKESKMETHEEPKEQRGISWGMRDDAEEEEIDMEKNPYNVMSQAEKEASYVKDPKKTLRGYFEREGLELEYNVEEKGSGFNKQYVCKVELPVDDAEGDPITAEAAVSGKKKEAVIACAAEACRILDAHGVLRQAVHESKQKKKKNWADDDFYDSDDDSYLDRTGIIEKKRTKRMIKAGVIKQEVDTYDSLLVKLSNVDEELKTTQTELDTLKQDQSTGSEEDTLDAFINQLKSGKTVDKTKRAKMKLRVIELKKEQTRLQRLIKLVQPASVTLGISENDKSQSKFAALSQRLPMKGFMKGRKIPQSKGKSQLSLADSSTSPAPSIVGKTNKMEENEEEEDDDDSDEEEEDNDKEEVAERGKMSKAGMITTSQIPQEITKSDTDLPTAAANLNSSKSEQENKQKISNEKMQMETNKSVSSKPPRVSPTQQRRPKRVLGPQMGPLIKFKEFVNRDEPESSTSSDGPDAKKKKDADFADWIPPDDQKGDGRTFLNEKYGY
ncbi:kanadaptin-like isoform X1 [Apostichopus japonicus]|uniref:kanadaptin-like isoform X1 n=1 Tax=Stichopus japonicus TaxID=307972 RepID=UPI003AB513B1